MTDSGPADAQRNFREPATTGAGVTAPRADGCTANVWAEDPYPRVPAVTLRRGGGTNACVLEAGCFAVNRPGDRQPESGRRFAGPREQCHSVGGHRIGVGCLTLLDATLTAIACRVRDAHWFGASDTVVGEVQAARLPPERGALICRAGHSLAARPGERAP